MTNEKRSEPTVSIAAVERDTGLSKDTLRVWERRYAFPTPMRGANGERAYPASQVEKLRLIKRLIDRGHRPGRLVAQPAARLAALVAVPRTATGAEMEGPLRLIKAHQVAALRQHLAQTLLKQGLQHFILDTIAPLTVAVGEGWMRGELAVFEEHLYTEQVQSLLRHAIASLPGSSGTPRVLLSSLPSEPHGLGLLMVETLLATEGAACIALGTQTPCDDIARAALAHRADIVGLSFSAMFGAKAAVAGLSQLRAMLPPSVEIWAGGECVRRLRRPVPGIELLGSLGRVLEAEKEWKERHHG